MPMPCFRCDARQTDPTRGDSPWQRGVVRGQQVLVCPDCQEGSGWAEGLDRCARCGSIRLVKALGAVNCRSCGLESWPDAPLDESPAASAASAVEGAADLEGVAEPTTPESEGGPPDLAAEVSAALERVLRRTPLPSGH
jgi:hypothetical protein